MFFLRNTGKTILDSKMPSDETDAVLAAHATEFVARGVSGALQFRAGHIGTDARGRSRCKDEAAAGLQSHHLRRRAGRTKPHRHGLGRARTPLGRRKLHLRGERQEIRSQPARSYSYL